MLDIKVSMLHSANLVEARDGSPPHQSPEAPWIPSSSPATHPRSNIQFSPALAALLLQRTTTAHPQTARDCFSTWVSSQLFSSSANFLNVVKSRPHKVQENPATTQGMSSGGFHQGLGARIHCNPIPTTVTANPHFTMEWVRFSHVVQAALPSLGGGGAILAYL